MDFDTKKLKVMGAMRDADLLEAFDILQDDNDALCLQSSQQIDDSGAICVISVILLPNRAYSLIYYYIAKLSNPAKKNLVLNILNNLNEHSLLVRYYLDSDNKIYGSVNYVGVERTFSSTEFIHILKVGYRDVLESYNTILNSI